MINILVDLLPTTVTVGGVEYPINTDFRTSILFEQMAVDIDIEDDEKWEYLLEYYYQGISVTDENIGGLVEEALKFYRCERGQLQSDDESCKDSSSSSSDKIYDFDYDDMYIYGAFLQQYGIDLQDIEYLHWWKFKAMFNSLKEECKFCKILEYRSIDLSQVQDDAQKEYYRKMKELYKLPTKVSIKEEERQKAIEECLKKGLDPSHLL